MNMIREIKRGHGSLGIFPHLSNMCMVWRCHDERLIAGGEVASDDDCFQRVCQVETIILNLQFKRSVIRVYLSHAHVRPLP